VDSEYEQLNHRMDGSTMSASHKTARAGPFCEDLRFAMDRLIGSIRRECVDHVIALGEQHLRQVLKAYASYYNTAKTHRSLDKDAPISRPVQRIGRIVSHALVGGLHHQYARI
jgi:Integrase core domain